MIALFGLRRTTCDVAHAGAVLIAAVAIAGCSSDGGNLDEMPNGGAGPLPAANGGATYGSGGAALGSGGLLGTGSASMATDGATTTTSVTCGSRTCVAMPSSFPGTPILVPCCADANASVCGTVPPSGGCVASTMGLAPGTGGSGGSGGAGGAPSGGGGTSGGPALGSGGSAGSAGAGMAGGGGIASTGGAGGASGASGSSGSACDGGNSLSASDASSSTRVSGYGGIDFQTAMGNQIVGLQTTLLAPAKPTSSTTLYVWPGLEPLPQAANFNPIGQGVLQPVLTWGSSCSMNSANPGGWWISALYVNPYTTDRAYYGCLGGTPIAVGIGDLLDITMTLKGTTWSQVVIDRQTGKMTTYDIDMMGQAQPWALFRIEQPTSNKPTSDIVFTSTTVTFGSADAMHCQPSKRGTNDYFAAPQVSIDSTKCCISRMILRAQGVTATTQNGP